MEKISKHLFDWNQPQLFSLIVTITIILVVSLIIFFKVKKQDPSKAPSGILLVAQGYVSIIDKTYYESTEGKIKGGRIYIFALTTFLLVGNMVGLLGLEPIVTSYSIAFTLALISWLGIFVVGLIYKKISFFKKYLNPIDLVGQVAPLISLSFRIFGNIIGGGTIVYLVYTLFGWLWTLLPGNGESFFWFAPIVTPFLHMYFDIFGAVIQALVFTSLTTVYWANEAEIQDKKNKDSKETKAKIINPNKNIY
ncbi:F0F1 ATP synthase subunit A [Mycoplasma sp. Mirounga ES2805-ORL]|uniref:F0F1 ATP synthase subunit A n=1 Tax=Mycoplasma sp. Mirounga ES2805-ORL TaxID=754514 RepID=UPI00197B8853|nr:F0F1 ATP synthase subunit A [Mycoplasma sp. Mirounga ES2805-ORL]QSF13830.1 F0F1 ATP synthase subunit A [Mycoplasma sp. Mirounga ES2805-ORL]